ncbi:hypothetical protein B0J14DRAFT_316564 [Halenospora varia]|nr:hypothetical protein B0J14DRAFT_316564 [Halenospora varia]
MLMSTCWRKVLPLYLRAALIAAVVAEFKLTSTLDSIVYVDSTLILNWTGASSGVDGYLQVLTSQPYEINKFSNATNAQAESYRILQSLVAGSYRFRLYDGTTSVWTSQFTVASAPATSVTTTSTKQVNPSTATPSRSSSPSTSSLLPAKSMQTTTSSSSSQALSSASPTTVLTSSPENSQSSTPVIAVNQSLPSTPLPTDISSQSSEPELTPISPSPSTLSIGAKTGIAIGAVCGICGLSGLLLLVVIRCRARDKTSLENSISEMQDWNGGRTNAVPFVMQEKAEVCGSMVYDNCDGDSGRLKTKWERERDRGSRGENRVFLRAELG